MRFIRATMMLGVIYLGCNQTWLYGESNRHTEHPSTLPIQNFVRFQSNDSGGGKMQVCIGHYANDSGIKVDLLSTMHIGETSFFRDMSQRFPRYDSVLYELVAPRGVPVDREGVNDQQRRIATECGLQNQGPHMNYVRSNFVHADLSLEEIKALEIEKHGTFKGALGDGPGLSAAQDKRDTAGQSEILTDINIAKTADLSERVRLMRRAYSKILEITAKPGADELYPPGMEVLISARDDTVMKVFRSEVAKGRTNLAIFYGAAHMMDLEHRLFELGFDRKSQEWITTWTVADDTHIK